MSKKMSPLIQQMLDDTPFRPDPEPMEKGFPPPPPPNNPTPGQ